jgi:uroporphyrinogen decarboxylase
MTTTWTPARRAITALTLGKPDEIPTFELEFYLSQAFFGCSLREPRLERWNRDKYSAAEQERMAIDLADRHARVFGNMSAREMGMKLSTDDEAKDDRPGLDYAIIPVNCAGWDEPEYPATRAFRKRLREHFGNTRLLGCHGDGTFGVPDGTSMFEFAYRLADEPEAVLADAKRMAEHAIKLNHRQKENDIDVSFLCSDYCYNSGPFLSPAMFDEFIAPFLTMICKAGREDGLYMIKHTDGNIMPILDSLAEAGPHALHSIDPMAGVDIREVKRLVGHKVALCGNVHCAALQTGTDEEVIASAEYCLKYGGEGGGYLFTTSNVPFEGMPPHRYQMILDIWKKHRKY